MECTLCHNNHDHKFKFTDTLLIWGRVSREIVEQLFTSVFITSILVFHVFLMYKYCIFSCILCFSVVEMFNKVIKSFLALD